MLKENLIPVTKTFFPPIQKYQVQLERIWKNGWITNRGELVEELEYKLRDYLRVKNIILTTNGTLPIQIALKLLAKKGEVITTSFSHVATTSAIIWEGCTPVFVDIDADYLSIDETKIEEAITPNTTAILATHVFGNPCNVEAIKKLAHKYNLKVIYDASHAFGVDYEGRSLFDFGDVSTCSFHATKLFHTGEGGAMFCQDENLNHQLFYSHNFGHKSFTEFYGAGINAKMSELQAAMGLSVLPYMGEILKARKKIVKFYNHYLQTDKIKTLNIRTGTDWNYSYYPVIFNNEKMMGKVEEKLNSKNIFPRRYFYPSLNKLEYVKGNSNPISESTAARIICLPLFVGLPVSALEYIVKVINEV